MFNALIGKVTLLAGPTILIHGTLYTLTALVMFLNVSFGGSSALLEAFFLADIIEHLTSHQKDDYCHYNDK
ncbi:MAG: hypothetical protein Q4D33_00975 [Prevotellaceae bacterium]|nr:hypothetical protein [Prevotellaceae bacterium]